jgi:putative phosphoribosyl transferase
MARKLAADFTTRVLVPVGDQVIEMNQDAMRQMRGRVTLEIIPGATHLFEERGALERVAGLAGDWFTRHLQPGE